MSLTRSIANPPLTTPKGIEFTLLDRSKIVRCIITQAALEKLASKELVSQQFEPTFHKHVGALCAGLQIHVEEAAYAHGRLRPWRLIALAVRVDMAAGIVLAAALFLWVTWH